MKHFDVVGYAFDGAEYCLDCAENPQECTCGDTDENGMCASNCHGYGPHPIYAGDETERPAVCDACFVVFHGDPGMKQYRYRACIRTHYVGPTNHRGSRVIATDDYPKTWPGERRRLVVHWDHALNPTENHGAAAQAWLDKFIPGSFITATGVSFNGCSYWTWETER
jgi:hypothetical protein